MTHDFKPVYDPPRDDESISPAVGHPKANKILKGPAGSGVGDLECEIITETYGTPDGGQFDAHVTRSRFVPATEQVEKLAQGGHLLLEVTADPTPPVWIGVEGPPCQNCNEEMKWDAAMKVWFCVHTEDEPQAAEEMGAAVPDPAPAS